ncbi:hypothetical protein C8F01DRAFT_1370653, partial [Mycena amicta]
MDYSQDHFTFTVGKLDAGMAILLGERARLIEFPSILLPPSATTASIVNIADLIIQEFGMKSPSPPQLQLRHVQTSITLEWPSIELATAKLRSLDIYRNGQRLAPISSPLTNTSTKDPALSSIWNEPSSSFSAPPLATSPPTSSAYGHTPCPTRPASPYASAPSRMNAPRRCCCSGRSDSRSRQKWNRRQSYRGWGLDMGRARLLQRAGRSP